MQQVILAFVYSLFMFLFADKSDSSGSKGQFAFRMLIIQMSTTFWQISFRCGAHASSLQRFEVDGDRKSIWRVTSLTPAIHNMFLVGKPWENPA